MVSSVQRMLLDSVNIKNVCIRLWVISGCADVSTSKRQIKSADVKCRCVGKRQMYR